MKSVKVKDIASFNASRFDFSKHTVIDYLDTGSLTENQIEETTTLNTEMDAIPSRAQRAVKDNTILYSTVRPRQHHYGILKNPPMNMVVSSGFVTIDADKEKIDPHYLYYVLTHPDNVEHICRIADSAVSSYPSFNPSDLAEMVIEIDEDIEEQKRISSILSNIEAKLKINNAIISELESMAKAIYDYWFVQFDFPDASGRPYRSSGGKMVWNEELKREIPAGWDVKPINSLVSTSRGISYSTESITGTTGVPMINLASFNVDASYKPAGLKLFCGEYSKDDVIHPLDLIMCNTQQTDLDPKKDIIGKTMLVPDLFDGDIVSSHHITRLQTEDLSMRVFLSATGKTAWFHKAMSGHCSGTSILGLDIKHALEYKLAIPEKTIRLSFSEKIVPIEKQKNVLMKENMELTSLRDWLLPMLMNGQVKVG